MVKETLGTEKSLMRFEQINSDRKHIEAKAGIIQFSAAIRQEGKAYKFYVPVVDVRRLNAKPGQRFKIFAQMAGEEK